MCRLQTHTYFLSDILNSNFTKLNPDALRDGFVRRSHEKFPVVQIPTAWWKHWTNILQTIARSISFERHNIGNLRQNHKAVWLQSKNRNYILKRIGIKEYSRHYLISESRNKYIYSKAWLSILTLSETGMYKPISIQEHAEGYITDGYSEKQI